MTGAGEYKEYVTVYRAEITVNSVGEELEDWKEVTVTRAKVEKTRGNRELIDSEIVYTSERDFTLRHYVDIKEYDHLEYQGKMYKVLNIDYFPERMEKKVTASLIND